MVPGRPIWIAIWFGILILGVAGLGGALLWGKQTQWRNLDEVFRGIGTILVSVGMLLLLYAVAVPFGRLLLVLALASFVFAFMLGRHGQRNREGG